MRDELPKVAIWMGSALEDGVYPTQVRRMIARDADLVELSERSPSTELADVTALMTSWDAPAIDCDVLAAAPRLRAIFHAAGSVKPVVTPEIFDRGIVVSSAAGEMAELVAITAYAFITMAAKKMLWQRALYQVGDWTPRPQRTALGFEGKVFGLVGGSRIGVAVARRLVADRRKVLLYDPYWTAERAASLGVELSDLDSMMARSDVVSLHAPDLDSTHHMIDRERLALLRDGAAIVNTARGRLIDTNALLQECATGRIEAFLDVTDPEPLPPGHGLHHLPNAFLTPHIAGNEGADLARMGMFAAEELRRYLHGEPLLGRVDPALLAQLA